MYMQESKGDSKQIGQYRSKLKALEAKLGALQKKVAANARLERLKTQSEEAAKRLMVDIQGIKRSRVEMLKKMERLSKEAADHRRAQEKALLQVYCTTIPLSCPVNRWRMTVTRITSTNAGARQTWILSM